MSESSGPQTFNVDTGEGKWRTGSCGPLLPGAHLKIHNPNNHGEGEVCVCACMHVYVCVLSMKLVEWSNQTRQLAACGHMCANCMYGVCMYMYGEKKVPHKIRVLVFPVQICYYGRHVFMGYLNEEEKTREAIDDEGWLHSGDIGKVDEDGFLYVTGRIKGLLE